MSINTISPVIIAKDAEKTIAETLESLKCFEEVILYLNNSTDHTEHIAQKYLNVKVIKGEFEGFGPTKNRAAMYAQNSWIFSLDSDEILSQALIKELESLTLHNEKELFLLKRDNYFLGKEIKYSGWGNDILARLYHRSYHQFNDNRVHEFVVPKEETLKTKLTHSFRHNAVDDINQFLHKVEKYSDLASHQQKTCSFFVVILKAKFAFFKTYVVQLGFLDGWRGFVIAISNFNGKFFRYTKRYINCKQPKE